MTKFVLRHWRGYGHVIPDVMKDFYQDYPKYRKVSPYKLADCLCDVLTEAEYLETMLTKYGVKAHNKMVIKYRLGKDKLIKEALK